MPKDDLGLLLSIEADRMARTIIDPASIEAEKGAVITELHSYENDPASVLLETVTRTAIQAHPYGSPMAGYVSDVGRLTIDDARDYYGSHYAPGNAVLAIVGDFTMQEARALVAKSFAEVPARPVAPQNLTIEPPQRGERRTQMLGAVERQYFQLAFPSPASSSPDFLPFLVLQEILSGGSGLNLRQSDWVGTAAATGSLLFGAAEDVATWLPPTREPFLFTIGGSIGAKADRATLERNIGRRIATLRDRPIAESRLAEAKIAVIRAIAEDVLTTEDAAHQLAFFEGIGALDVLLDAPRRIAKVTAADIQRVARSYLAPDRLTVGWMVPGRPPRVAPGIGKPQPAADRAGAASAGQPAGRPQLRRLSGGLPAIVQSSPLSDTATIELVLSASVDGDAQPADLSGFGAIIRSGRAEDLAMLVDQAVDAAGKPPAATEAPSDDPATRLEQLISAQIDSDPESVPRPVTAIVSGNVDPEAAFSILERHLGKKAPGQISRRASAPATPKIIRERIARPLAQGGIGYVAEGPAPGTREALAWRMLLYVLTHDYSGRLGQSAITEKGIVYHIYSSVRTDGARSWATISTGVDPDKSDVMEAELRAQLARLVSEPPSTAELEAARNHMLGRDITAAQSNDEITAKLAREFIETGGLRSHEQLREQLRSITSADLVRLAPALANSTLIRVDVGGD
jgi:zinc protease